MSVQQKRSLLLIVLLVFLPFTMSIFSWYQSKIQSEISTRTISIMEQSEKIKKVYQLVLRAQYEKERLNKNYDYIDIFGSAQYWPFIESVKSAAADIKIIKLSGAQLTATNKVKKSIDKFVAGAKISTVNSIISNQYAKNINIAMGDIANDLTKLSRIQQDLINKNKTMSDKKTLEMDITFIVVIIVVVFMSIFLGIKLRNQTKQDIKNRLISAEKEMQQKLARNIRDSLFPQGEELQSDFFDVAAYMDTPDQIGGDYYDFIKKGGFTWCPIGDTTGHDMTSAMFAMSLKFATELTIEQSNNMTPYQFLEELNRRVNRVKNKMIEKTPELNKKSATFLIAKINNLTGECEYAGTHTDMIVYRAKTGLVEICKSGDMALEIGQINNSVYSVMINKQNSKINKITLDQGDKIIMYTDGITEAKIGKDCISSSGKMLYNGLGVDGLVDLIKKYGVKSSTDLISSIIDDLSGCEFGDDLTIMAIGRK